MTIDHNLFLVAMATGLFMAVVLPQLINLKVFVRSSEFSDYKEANQKEMAAIYLYINEHFVRKDDLIQFKADLDKRLDEIRDTQKDIFRILNERKG